MSPSPRLLILGLDCAEPSLIFERWRDDLPTLSRLAQTGLAGPLESCIPAITIPAWSCMMSGRDPGELGIYGFRNRADRNYHAMTIANSHAVRAPRLWNILSNAGWRVAVIGVPGTFPPQPVNGAMVSCFLAPNINVPYTHPPELAAQIDTWCHAAEEPHPYLLDVPNFRSDEKARILRDIYTMANQRFLLAHRLLESEHPDMMMLVDMGVDRIHHAFWRYMDSTHPLHEPDSPFANAIFDYYRHIDQQIAALLACCDDETTVLVVSDHGGRPLMGGIGVNEWLIQHGYLVLKEAPARPCSLDKAEIDWAQTRAWGAGGYYGRIFLNVRGREPEGVIAPIAYEQERQQLAEELAAIPAPDGQPLGTRVFTPQQLYRTVRGVAPDLLVYFGDLAWRSVGTIGTGEIYHRENDTGPDDANHAQHGLFIFSPSRNAHGGQWLDGAQIYDILPSLLAHVGLAAPSGLRGRVLL